MPDPVSIPPHCEQSYDAWFTVYPSTHEKGGQTVEVVTREWAKAEVERARESEKQFSVAENTLEGR